jgi:hypothetical protein
MLTQSGLAILANYNRSATERSVLLGNIAYGSKLPTFDMPNAGIPTRVQISFSGKVEVTNTATTGTVTASPFWPFNLLGLSTFRDPVGNVRIFADGNDLYWRDLSIMVGADLKSPLHTENYQSQVFSATLPTGVASATVTSPVNFSVNLPISLAGGTVQGSYAAAIADTQAQFIGLENAVVGDNILSPLQVTGKTTATVSGTWNGVYYYMDAPASVPVPLEALSLYHELYHQQADKSNLASNGKPKQNLLTAREYYRIIVGMVANNKNVLTQTNVPISQLDFIVNGGTPTKTERFRDMAYAHLRKYLSNFPFLYWDFANNPWDASGFGSLAVEETLSSSFSSGTVSQIWTLRDCLYAPTNNLVKIGG